MPPKKTAVPVQTEPETATEGGAEAATEVAAPPSDTGAETAPPPPDTRRFASVVEFSATADGPNYHAREAVNHLGELGLAAKIVDTQPDGRTKQLLVDISASVQASTGVV